MDKNEIWDKMLELIGEEKIPFSCLFTYMTISELEDFLEYLEFEIENGARF